jgi:hypothetical protein
VTEQMLAGEARIEGEGQYGSMEAEIAAIKAKYNRGQDERMTKCIADRKAPPIDERGDWFYGKFKTPHQRQRSKEDFEKRVGGIYGRSANNWSGAVIEFTPHKNGKVKHGKLLKVSDPGTDQARALVAWLFVEDLTHSEVESMSTIEWPYRDHHARVIQQPRMGRD